MKSRSILVLGVIASAQFATAQPPALDIPRYMPQIRGELNPDGIPRAVVVRALRLSVGGVALTDSDANIMSAWAEEASRLIEQHSKESENWYRRMCSEVAADEKTAREVYAEADRMDEEHNTEQVARLDDALARLSSQGRSAVEGFIQTRLVPSTNHIVMDHEALTTIDEEFVTKQIAFTCDLKLNSSPEELQKLAERARAQRENNDSLESTGGGVTQQSSGGGFAIQ